MNEKHHRENVILARMLGWSAAWSPSRGGYFLQDPQGKLFGENPDWVGAEAFAWDIVPDFYGDLNASMTALYNRFPKACVNIMPMRANDTPLGVEIRVEGHAWLHADPDLGVAAAGALLHLLRAMGEAP